MKEIKRLHYSRDKKIEFRDIVDVNADNFKPRGLWYSIDDAWMQWVMNEQPDWLVGEAERDTVSSMRARNEGIIGTLKMERYGFNRPKTRSTTTTEMAGQRSFVSKNLNKLMSDLLAKKMEI